jgi:homocysteine S-methyltransferase
MRNAVSLALAARDDFWASESNRAGRLRPLVATSIGPYGAMLADGSEYRGRYAVDDATLAEFHRQRLQVLAGAGGDVLACETIPGLREARILVDLLREFPDTPAWISFSCKDGAHNCEGEDIGACVAELQNYPQIVAVGVNCTAPKYIVPLLQRMRARTTKPLIVYPNSGEVFDAACKHWSGEVPLRLGHEARHWLAAGARLIGGCCRTTPSDIRDVKLCTQS